MPNKFAENHHDDAMSLTVEHVFRARFFYMDCKIKINAQCTII